jgi:hypothetical protein
MSPRSRRLHSGQSCTTSPTREAVRNVRRSAGEYAGDERFFYLYEKNAQTAHLNHYHLALYSASATGRDLLFQTYSVLTLSEESETIGK